MLDKITPLELNYLHCTFYEGLDLFSNDNVNKDQLFNCKSAEHSQLYCWIKVILSSWESGHTLWAKHRDVYVLLFKAPYQPVTEAPVCGGHTGPRTDKITDFKTKLCNFWKKK